MGSDSVVYSRAYANGANGIDGSNDSTVSNCTSSINRLSGFNLVEGNVISESTATDNGSNGIVTDDGSTVQRSVMRQNGGFGLICGATKGSASFRANNIDGNTTGTAFCPDDAGGNVCNARPCS